MAEKERRGPFYLITGLILGMILGAFYGWIISPVSYFDISPQSLHEDFKVQYFVMTGLAYDADHDVGRAYHRIGEMMNPVEDSSLREYLSRVEERPDLAEDYETLRRFVNDLSAYIQSGQAEPIPTHAAGKGKDR